MIFLSKYLSRAKDNKNKENKEIRIEGIKVNKAKKVIYFLLALEPLMSISIFKDFLTSMKIKKKKKSSKIILITSSNCKLLSLKTIKLLSMKVKKVKNAKNSVIIKTKQMNKFFLIKSIIMR